MPISESRASKRAEQPSSAKGNDARRTRRWPLRVGVLAVGAIAVAAPMVAAEPASAPVQPPTTEARAAVAIASSVEPVTGGGFGTIADAAHLTAVVTSQTAAEVEVTPPTTTTTTTTTTTPPTTTAPPAPTPAPAPAAEPSSGRCGGNLPPCYIMQRESGGSLTAKNPSSTASGKWQFLDSTWAGYGGYAHAWQAPESVQDAKAAQLWAGGAGCSHWSACG